MDRITKAKRSDIMSRVRCQNTKPEEIVRKYLFSEGFRYRKNDKRYPGKPDIVLPKYKTIIFVNGCFWHQHYGCKAAALPEANHQYWEEKLNKNVERDKQEIQQLKDMGWRVIVVWECEISSKKKQGSRLSILKNEIKYGDTCEII